MRYLTLTKPDINNGSGCRVTVWVAGCSHHCMGCHNPETWDYEQGKKSIWSELKVALDDPHMFGVTFSGGDPLAQDDSSLEELNVLIDKVRENFPEKDIWLFTGDLYEEAMQHPIKAEIINKCDVLVDGPFKITLKDLSLPFRGSSNQRIILINENYPYHINGAKKVSEL